MYILYTCIIHVYYTYVLCIIHIKIWLISEKKDSIKNSVVSWHGRKLVNTGLTRSVTYDLASNQIQLPVRSCSSKAVLQSLEKNVYLVCGLGVRKPIPCVQVK